MATERLRCKVSIGQFTKEVAVAGEDHDGVLFSFFVEKKFVDFQGEPERGRDIDGLLHVEALDQRDDLVLVRLPGRTFENGSTITVNKSQLAGTSKVRQPI